MKFEIVRSSDNFNPATGRYIFLFIALSFVVLKFYASYRDYKNQVFHRFDVTYYKANKDIDYVKLSNGQIELKQQAQLVIIAETYGQYLLLELDPNTKEYITLFFCLNFLLVVIIYFFIMNHSKSEGVFNNNFLKLLNFAKNYCYVFFFLKIFQEFGFHYFLESLNTKQGVYFDHISTPNTQLYIILFAIIIFTHYYQTGLKLQQEQDLTV